MDIAVNKVRALFIFPVSVHLPVAVLYSSADAIRKVDEHGNEYWSARELYKILGYTEWRNFNNVVIKRAMKACEENERAVADHFVRSYKAITGGKGAQQQVQDVLLSRYAAYLVVMNGDPKMPVVAMGQEYFAEQTRRQEIADELALMSEDELRLLRRGQMNIYNTQLAAAAQQSGVIAPIDFAIFQDHGYRGLYGGLGAKNIHARKGLKKREQILDHMGSDELAANIFRASQTKQKLERDQVQGKEQANQTHFEVGSKVRQTIQDLGGTMPENLP
ncbi:MAG TPA: DNA damage-inducible protein D, partial [Ktedonobacter sp.]|nr:DNA damage-inducible protein D [Ktedonobacter sp.]